MESEKAQLDPVQTLAVLYLVAPLFVFFVAFIRIEIAVPASILIAYQFYSIISRTAWRRSMELLSYTFLSCVLSSVLLLCWVYGSLSLQPPGDWSKHYAVVNFLAKHSWPPLAPVEGMGDVTLRYYIGWYLIPAIALKLTGAAIQHIAMLAWSALGLSLFFKLLMDLVGYRRAVIVVPFAFLAFGGAKLIGYAIERGHFTLDSISLAWWADWIQYSSNLTAISWVPQHTLPAWLGVALLMRQRDSSSLVPFYGVLVAAIILWSPFAAVGLVPFFCLMAAHHGVRSVVLDWRPLVSIVLLAVPVALYLTYGAAQVPHGFIGSLPCSYEGALCFNWLRYCVFILVEIAAPIALLFWSRERERGFLVAAAITLCLIPFYWVGAANDFAMRASLPAIAVLSILCLRLLMSGPRRYSVLILAVLLSALPEVYSDLVLPLNSKEKIAPDTTFPSSVERELLPQYLVSPPVWILRGPPLRGGSDATRVGGLVNGT